MTVKERYLLLKNRQAKDWWTATFGDPFSWWILAVIGDQKWVTPNGLTILSFFAKLVPALMFIQGDRSIVIWAVIILQIGQILDSMDGNLARYRHVSSSLGSFLDKILDGFGLLLVLSGVSWYAFNHGAEAYYLILGPMAAGFYLVICYIYWVVAYTDIKHHGELRKVKPGKNVRSLESIPVWKYILNGQKKILYFNQADFYFWIGLFMILDKPKILIWMFVVLLGRKVIVRFFNRARYLKQLEASYD